MKAIVKFLKRQNAKVTLARLARQADVKILYHKRNGTQYQTRSLDAIVKSGKHYAGVRQCLLFAGHMETQSERLAYMQERFGRNAHFLLPLVEHLQG